MTIELQKLRDVIESTKPQHSTLVFLNRHGEIDSVSGELREDKDVWIDLISEARAQSGGPYFEILSVLSDGTVMIHSDLCEPTTDVLEAALNDAGESRNSFYAERAAEYGPSAYPSRSQTV